jgi:hypothetical protein
MSQPHAISYVKFMSAVAVIDRGDQKKALNEPIHYFDIKCNARVVEAAAEMTKMFPLKLASSSRAALHG